MTLYFSHHDIAKQYVTSRPQATRPRDVTYYWLTLWRGRMVIGTWTLVLAKKYNFVPVFIVSNQTIQYDHLKHSKFVTLHNKTSHLTISNQNQFNMSSTYYKPSISLHSIKCHSNQPINHSNTNLYLSQFIFEHAISQ